MMTASLVFLLLALGLGAFLLGVILMAAGAKGKDRHLKAAGYILAIIGFFIVLFGVFYAYSQGGSLSSPWSSGGVRGPGV